MLAGLEINLLTSPVQDDDGGPVFTVMSIGSSRLDYLYLL